MTSENERDFQNSTKCHICERYFKPNDLVMYLMMAIKRIKSDHCHITGKYRGAAHRGCNLEWSLSKKTKSSCYLS